MFELNYKNQNGFYPTVAKGSYYATFNQGPYSEHTGTIKQVQNPQIPPNLVAPIVNHISGDDFTAKLIKKLFQEEPTGEFRTYKFRIKSYGDSK